HTFSTDGVFAVSLTVTDNDGLTDTTTYEITVGTGAPSEGIDFLDSNNPLANAAWELGGSAGAGTHGGTHVDRPANMPTRAEANYICSSTSDLRSAINNAGNGDIIYIDSDIDISSFDGLYLPTNCKLVAGFCDP